MGGSIRADLLHIAGQAKLRGGLGTGRHSPYTGEAAPRLPAREVEHLRRCWERAADHGEAIDPYRDLMRFTARVTMQFVFSVDLGAPESPGASIRHHLAAIFPVLHRRLNLPLPFWRCFRLPSDRALERALAGLKAEVRDMIRTAKERMEENPRRSVTPGNFIEASIAARGCARAPLLHHGTRETYRTHKAQTRRFIRFEFIPNPSPCPGLPRGRSRCPEVKIIFTLFQQPRQCLPTNAGTFHTYPIAPGKEAFGSFSFPLRRASLSFVG